MSLEVVKFLVLQADIQNRRIKMRRNLFNMHMDNWTQHPTQIQVESIYDNKLSYNGIFAIAISAGRLLGHLVQSYSNGPNKLIIQVFRYLGPMLTSCNIQQTLHKCLCVKQIRLHIMTGFLVANLNLYVLKEIT